MSFILKSFASNSSVSTPREATIAMMQSSSYRVRRNIHSFSAVFCANSLSLSLLFVILFWNTCLLVIKKFLVEMKEPESLLMIPLFPFSCSSSLTKQSFSSYFYFIFSLIEACANRYFIKLSVWILMLMLVFELWNWNTWLGWLRCINCLLKCLRRARSSATCLVMYPEMQFYCDKMYNICINKCWWSLNWCWLIMLLIYRFYHEELVHHLGKRLLSTYLIPEEALRLNFYLS